MDRAAVEWSWSEALRRWPNLRSRSPQSVRAILTDLTDGGPTTARRIAALSAALHLQQSPSQAQRYLIEHYGTDAQWAMSLVFGSAGQRTAESGVFPNRRGAGSTTAERGYHPGASPPASVADGTRKSRRIAPRPGLAWVTAMLLLIAGGILNAVGTYLPYIGPEERLSDGSANLANNWVWAGGTIAIGAVGVVAGWRWARTIAPTAAAAGLGAIAVGVRLRDLILLSERNEVAGSGFVLQTAGDACLVAAATIAVVLLRRRVRPREWSSSQIALWLTILMVVGGLYLTDFRVEGSAGTTSGSPFRSESSAIAADVILAITPFLVALFMSFRPRPALAGATVGVLIGPAGICASLWISLSGTDYSASYSGALDPTPWLIVETVALALAFVVSFVVAVRLPDASRLPEDPRGGSH